jgi:hypothetical protein
MNDQTHMFQINLFKDQEPQTITPNLYGAVVNCVGLKATISHVGEIQDNSVIVGVETVSSGWSASNLEATLKSYPPLKEYSVTVIDA